ncbi:MAG: FkbM family methyltransferase [Patescibacteria group bacterium]
MTKKIYKFVKLLIPPIFILVIKKTISVFRLGDFFAKHNLRWSKIIGGELVGREIFLDPDGPWRGMISGNYDNFLFNYLKQFDLKGKTIYDIGAHIGFSSLVFANMVGGEGTVIAFEPNVYNRDRFEMILTKNEDLKKIIQINHSAVSDHDGEEDFVFTDNVDGGTSSGSFLGNADTFWEKDIYEKNIGFKRTKVKTVTLDNLMAGGSFPIPAVIKMDIEGAEYLAVAGGLESIKKNQIKLLIEIHSIFNMFKVAESLASIDYKLELLQEEKDGRCFMAATPF